MSGFYSVSSGRELTSGYRKRQFSDATKTHISVIFYFANGTRTTSFIYFRPEG